MRTTANIVVKREKKILLLFKKTAWILPGGKHEEGETDEECIIRECSEEIPGAIVSIGPKIGTFVGITPNSKTMMSSTAYHGTVTGDVTASAEIDKSGWFTEKELLTIPVSEITKEILDSISF